MLLDAVRKMTVQDAKAILAGGDDSATQYLNKSSREQIRARFPRIVKQATDQVGLAQQYNAVAARFRRPERQLRQYRKLRDRTGAERPVHGDRRAGSSIRKNPAAAATSLAKKVFGAL